MITTPEFPACTTKLCETEELWLGRRRIGASDTAGIFGEGYAGQSAVSIWEEKTTRQSNVEETKRMRIGRIMEPALREIFTDETGMPCHGLKRHVLTSKDTGFMTATLDAVVDHPEFGATPAELKNVDGRLLKDWQDDEPLKFKVQCQHQMFVTGVEAMYLMGLIGGNEPIVKVIRRSQEFIDAMLPRLAAFWQHVTDKTMPPIDGSMATSDALKRLYPGDNGKSITLPEEADGWAADLKAAKATIKEAEAEKREAENHLKAALGENTFGVLPGGGSLSLKATVRQNTAREASTSTFRVLRAKG